MKMPAPIKLAFAIEILLILAYILPPWHGSWTIQQLFDLDQEFNIPTYFSTIQLFLVALAFGVLAWFRAHWREPRSILLWLLPALFLCLSIDEFISLHEKLGAMSDVFLPGGTRDNGAFWNTGIWMFVLGIPCLAASLFVFWTLRSYLSSSPGVFGKLVLGFLVFMGGALGVEMLSNFLAPDSPLQLWSIALEEGMEMAGVTIVFWAALDNLKFQGITIQSVPPEPARPDTSTR